MKSSISSIVFVLVALMGFLPLGAGAAVGWGVSFPPVKNERERDFTLSQLRELGVKRVRIGESWAIREPKRGVFNWAPLDARIQWAQTNGIQLLITIETKAPDWARSSGPSESNSFCRDEADFRLYIEAFWSRYAGRLYALQFANEWDSWVGYAGDEESLIRFNNIVWNETKKNSPTTLVVLGGMTQALPLVCERRAGRFITMPDEKTLQKGLTMSSAKAKVERKLQSLDDRGIEARVRRVLAGAQYDLVDVHLYDVPEQWATFMKVFRELVDKPIIVTEFGCVNPACEVYTHAYHAQRLAKCLEVIQTLPILEAYHFTLVDHADAYHKNNGLIDSDLARKSSWDVFLKTLRQGL